MPVVSAPSADGKWRHRHAPSDIRLSPNSGLRGHWLLDGGNRPRRRAAPCHRRPASRGSCCCTDSHAAIADTGCVLGHAFIRLRRVQKSGQVEVVVRTAGRGVGVVLTVAASASGATSAGPILADVAAGREPGPAVGTGPGLPLGQECEIVSKPTPGALLPGTPCPRCGRARPKLVDQRLAAPMKAGKLFSSAGADSVVKAPSSSTSSTAP